MNHEQPPHNGRPAERGWIKTQLARLVAFALRFRLVRALLLYLEHRGPALADAVTYRLLFSVFAAVLLGFSVAALWLGANPEVMGALVDALDSVIPGLGDLIDVDRIQAPAGFTVAGVIALAGLIGAAIGAIGSLRAALRSLADRSHADMNVVLAQLRNLLLAVSFGGLLVAAAVLSVASSVGVQTVASWIGVDFDSGAGRLLTRVLGVIIVFAIDTAAIALIFRLLSGVRAPARALWFGAMLGGAGVVVLQELSGLFVRGATSNPLLASFASLVALLLWLNLSTQVILVASCYILVATREAHDRVRERFGASSLAQWRRRRAEDRVHAATRDLDAAREAEASEAQ